MARVEGPLEDRTTEKVRSEGCTIQIGTVGARKIDWVAASSLGSSAAAAVAHVRGLYAEGITAPRVGETSVDGTEDRIIEKVRSEGCTIQIGTVGARKNDWVPVSYLGSS